jgi:hypothetical protein
MNRPFLKKVFPQALAWAAMIVLCGVIALAQNTAAGQRSDGQIEMDVVHALDASTVLKNDLITAATIQSEVTLAGTVSSDSSKQLAESISSHVAGVTKVHNNLKVGNPQDQQVANTGETDTEQMSDNQSDNSAADSSQSTNQQYSDQSQNQSNSGQYQNQQGYSQNQGQYQNQAPDQQGYAYAQPPTRTYDIPRGPVTMPKGTLIQLRTSEPVGSKNAQEGSPVQFIVIQDVTFGNVLAIPRGAVVHGVVTTMKRAGNSGDLAGSSELALALTSLDLGGQSYPLQTDQFKVKGPNKAGRTVGSAFGGALIGAIIGGAVGNGEGAAIGAGVGAVAGTTASAASSGPGVWIPAEAQVDFHLMAPITVAPVSQQEAARLSQGLYQGGPSLYQRGPYPPNGPYGGPYPDRYYPRVYYRPYYYAGGYYYWR